MFVRLNHKPAGRPALEPASFLAFVTNCRATVALPKSAACHPMEDMLNLKPKAVARRVQQWRSARTLTNATAHFDDRMCRDAGLPVTVTDRRGNRVPLYPFING